jgi:hypothetical protein
MVQNVEEYEYENEFLHRNLETMNNGIDRGIEQLNDVSESYIQLQNKLQTAYSHKNNEKELQALIWENYELLTNTKDTGLSVDNVMHVISNLEHQSTMKKQKLKEQQLACSIASHIMDILASEYG